MTQLTTGVQPEGQKIVSSGKVIHVWDICCLFGGDFYSPTSLDFSDRLFLVLKEKTSKLKAKHQYKDRRMVS